MNGLEKILLPKKKDNNTKGIKGIINKFLTLTDYTLPYAWNDADFRFNKYLDFIVEFDDLDKLYLGKEVIYKVFEPVDPNEKYWRPRILNYNFYAVDDVTRFFIALEIMKKIASQINIKVVKVKINNHFSAVLFNYIMWRIGANIKTVKDAIPYGYKTITTNSQLHSIWKYIESEYPGFIPLPGEWDEEGDNTVYSIDSSKYIYVKFPIFYRIGTLKGGFKLFSIVVEKETRKSALFNSNYGAIVFYALTDNFTKLQDYVKENKNIVIQPVYPNEREFFLRVMTEGIEALAHDIKNNLTSNQFNELLNSKAVLMYSDKVFNRGSYISWSFNEYSGNEKMLVIGGEHDWKEVLTGNGKGDWYNNLLNNLDRALDWGITMVFAGDITSNPEYYSPTKKEYLEELLSIADEKDLEELRKKGYDV